MSLRPPTGGPVETSESYVMGQEAADIVYCDADPADRGPLDSLDDAPDVESLDDHLDPDDEDEWLAGYSSRMAELLADPVEIDPAD